MITSTLSVSELNYILDKSKTEILLGKQASFFGSILCSLETVWTDSVHFAATDGIQLFINTDWWLTLTMPTRRFVLKHELEHVARLHMLRKGDRDMRIWVRACDAVINQFLIQDGESILDIEWLINMPQYANMAEEKVYDLMMEEEKQNPSDDDGLEDMIEPSQGQAAKVINTIIRATQQAKLYGKPTDVPSYVNNLVQRFMEPMVKWEVVLHDWLTNLTPGGRTWKRPNRRFNPMYLPSKDKVQSTLDHLMYFFDTSASITDEMVMRFNSEVRYIKEIMNPKMLTLVQFDTQIRDIRVFEQSDEFELTEVSGRGNTSLDCIHDHIQKENPTAAIIFSDMECEPMAKPANDTAIIWAVLNNPQINIPYGTILHIRA